MWERCLWVRRWNVWVVDNTLECRAGDDGFWGWMIHIGWILWSLFLSAGWCACWCSWLLGCCSRLLEWCFWTLDCSHLNWKVDTWRWILGTLAHFWIWDKFAFIARNLSVLRLLSLPGSRVHVSYLIWWKDLPWNTYLIVLLVFATFSDLLNVLLQTAWTFKSYHVNVCAKLFFLKICSQYVCSFTTIKFSKLQHDKANATNHIFILKVTNPWKYHERFMCCEKKCNSANFLFHLETHHASSSWNVHLLQFIFFVCDAFRRTSSNNLSAGKTHLSLNLTHRKVFSEHFEEEVREVLHVCASRTFIWNIFERLK